MGTLVGGRFRVERLLANGGMGRVYVARQEGLQRRVALKVVRDDDDALPEREGQQRLRIEAEMLGRLAHPNIVTVHDFGDLDATGHDRSYLAMEMLDGPTLAQRMDADPRLPTHLVLEVAEQMVVGLRFAHENGIVHRDMKPSNVVLIPSLDQGGGAHRVKIIDFGTGKLLLPHARELSGKRLTKDGYTIGTPEYMAPEQLEGRPCAASDLFAVGVIMFEALTGTLPFTPASGSRASPPRLRDVAPDLVVPDDVEELVFRLLAVTPAERPRSNDVLSALRRCLSELQRRPRATTTSTRVPAPRPGVGGRNASTRGWALAAAALVVIATALLVVLAAQLGEPAEGIPHAGPSRARAMASMPRTLAVSANAKATRVAPRLADEVEAAPAPTPGDEASVKASARITASPAPAPVARPSPASAGVYTEFRTDRF